VIGRTVVINAEVSDSPTVVSYSGDTNVPGSYGDLPGPTSEPLTDKNVRRLFVGKTFIFSIVPRTGSQPYWATAWPVNSRRWVMKTLRLMNGSACPLPYDARHPVAR
jgi:hypothetical protein